MTRRLTMLALLLAALGFGLSLGGPFAQTAAPPPPAKPAEGLEVATFAGGCFWCVEVDFDKMEGVVTTISGFMGGTVKNPSYQRVVAGDTGHLEVVQVSFDPKKISYQKLVMQFFRTIDPYDDGGQFCDRGQPYRTAVFAHSDAQRAIAERIKADLDKNGPLKKPLATRVLAASEFTAAEDYHQDFYKKSPGRYYSYRAGCGRDARTEQLWGKKATN
ncbi:MAG: peptide-methionine (S)-S-oxide reductase MsrA [Hyphomicrobiaceae bacterium]